MPNTAAIQNSFIGGLKTEYTGLNFPENACTQVDNFVFTITGDVTRRGGLNFEANATQNSLSFGEQAFVTYKWNNVGGDGQTQLVVQQIGGTIYFYTSSSATTANPLSSQLSGQTITLSNHIAASNGQTSTFDSTLEAQFADGNGVLFIMHPSCEIIVVTYSAGTISAQNIKLKVRDFIGYPESGVQFNTRPPNLSIPHQYNLLNAGWTQGSPYTAVTNTPINLQLGTSTAIALSAQSNTSTTGVVGSTISIAGIACAPSFGCAEEYSTALVNAYNATAGTMTVTVNSSTGNLPGTVTSGNQQLTLVSTGNIGIWVQALAYYPSLADVWWQYKNSAGVFSPSTTINNTTINNAPAPNGYYILHAFDQNRNSVSAVPTQTVWTLSRPRTGAWYQGRSWFAGVDATFQAINGAPYTTWTENVYFSQVVEDSIVDLTGLSQYGNCYQVNDPTSETLFSLLPTDGGVIHINGSGAIYKLFPVTNGLLVFAANGVWFITGSGGLGFTANDYSINKISNIRVISGTSFIDVYGYPVFWNEEGIWTVTPNSDAVPYGHGGLKVENLCIGTILTYFNNIPLISKKYAHGAFDPINYTIQWLFRSTNETDVTSRYQYDTILCLNVINRAFYLYTISNGSAFIPSVIYVDSPGGSTAPNPVFKYLTASSTSGATANYTFSEENDFSTYSDFASLAGGGFNYTSSFQAGYALHGQAIKKWNPEYLYVYVRNPSIPPTGGSGTGYIVNGIWDYATSPDSGRISTAQQVIDFNPNYAMSIRRHRLRGRGYAFQLQVQSVPGLPLDLMGWSIYEHQAKGP